MSPASPLLWQREDVLCELFCIRLRNALDPDDYGSVYPDPECTVHWAPGYEDLKEWLQQERLARWRKWKAGRFRASR